jgi:hypothetical protein
MPPVLVKPGQIPGKTQESRVPSVDEVKTAYISILANLMLFFKQIGAHPITIRSIGKIIQFQCDTAEQAEAFIQATAQEEVEQIKLMLLHESIQISDEVN